RQQVCFHRLDDIHSAFAAVGNQCRWCGDLLVDCHIWRWLDRSYSLSGCFGMDVADVPHHLCASSRRVGRRYQTRWIRPDYGHFGRGCLDRGSGLCLRFLWKCEHLLLYTSDLFYRDICFWCDAVPEESGELDGREGTERERKLNH